MRIEKLSSKFHSYEVGKGEVASIDLTGHGNEVTHIYKVVDNAGKLILHAGFIDPYEIEYVETSLEVYEQITMFDF